MWRIAVGMVFVAGVAIAQVGDAPPVAPPAPPSPAMGASPEVPPDASVTAPRWSSLQVLPADVSEQDLRRVMTEIAKGLRVKCTHCHEKGDEAAETPMKHKAREHLRMTIALQRDWFAADDAPRVTCALCHRGRAVPADASR